MCVCVRVFSALRTGVRHESVCSVGCNINGEMRAFIDSYDQNLRHANSIVNVERPLTLSRHLVHG